jgi:hypothetical protein
MFKKAIQSGIMALPLARAARQLKRATASVDLVTFQVR